MQFRKIGNVYVIRLDRGDEIIKNIADFCSSNKIKLGYFSGIGAVNKAELAHYIADNKKYSSKLIEKPLEIVNLTGNVTTMNKEPYLHAHIALSDENMNVFGGHLKSAIISATCEIFLVAVDSEIGRKPDRNIGLNLIGF